MLKKKRRLQNYLGPTEKLHVLTKQCSMHGSVVNVQLKLWYCSLGLINKKTPNIENIDTKCQHELKIQCILSLQFHKK